MTITEMREKRNKLVGMMDTFLDTHTTDKGTLSAEDDKTYKDMETEVAQLTDSIHRMERREEIEAELSKPTSKPLTGKPMKADGDKAVKTGRASDEYKKALLQAMRTNFRQISNVLQEGIDPQGGYLVPDEYDKRLIDILTEENVMRTLGTNITTSGEHKINIAATKPAAAWIEEGGTLTFGDATFDQIILDAHKLHVAIKVTEELLYDNAFNLENYILTQFGKALSNAEEDAFINGTGVGQPLGILAETGGAQVGVTSASSTKVTADEIINLVYSLKRPYRKNAVFLANDVCVAELRKLKNNNGQYLWQPSLQAGEPDRVLGYKVYTSPYFPVPTAGGTAVAFGDFSYYNIGDRGTRSFAELKELFAGNGMIGFVAKERVDGKLVLPEAIKLLQMKSGS
jgi:HK97 family phage major capsid protein